MDVASSNNPDMDLFRRHFPSEAAQLSVIWRSPLIPSGVLVMRDGLAAPLRRQLTDFILAYGKAPGETGVRERAQLARIPRPWAASLRRTTGAAVTFVDMQYALLRRQ